MKERLIGRKQILGSDGQNYEALVYEELKAIPSKSGIDYIPGMRRLALADGREIIRLNNVNTLRGTNITFGDID